MSVQGGSNAFGAAMTPLLCSVLVSIAGPALPVTPEEAREWREDLHYFAELAPKVHKAAAMDT
jgi:hypothetical protein